MLNALNEVLRDDFVGDSVGGVERWNKRIEKGGVSQRLYLPHKAFNRRIGTLAGVKVSPHGEVLTEAQWRERVDDWLPTAADRAFVASLMGRVVEPGRFAGWIAPPATGIDNKPIAFEYVRFG
jgi:benzoyl-CoA 2,3-dioxygenase component B